ncbi:MAG: hypothetical protein WCI67_01620 [Chloroflexales bacterium]
MSDSHKPASPPESEGLVKVVVGPIEAPLAELIAYDRPFPASPRPVSLDPSVVTTIGDMLRILPGIVGAGIQASSPAYLLTFAPNVTAQLQAGSASIMHALDGGVRAVAVDASGRIIGNGTLVAAPGLSSIATAAMLWQTLALVTAQHYLHDMQQQLREISTAVNDIHDTLLAKENARLFGHERSLQRIMSMVQRGAAMELNMTEISNQLEQMDRECDEVQDLMRHQMERQVPRIKATPIWAWFHWEVEDNVAAAQKYVDAFNDAVLAFTASVRMKVMIAAVRAYLLQQPTRSLIGLEEAAKDISRGCKTIVDFYKEISSLGEVWAPTDIFGFLNDLRKTLLNQYVQRLSGLQSLFAKFDTDLNMTQRQIMGMRDHLLPAVLIQHGPDGTLLVYEAPQEPVSQSVG